MKYQINLFPEKKLSAADKIIYFSLHYLRYILVITQFVAICVFFYRFKVDQDIVDLKDTLIQKQHIIESTQMLLDEIKELDAKISNVKPLLTRQSAMVTMYQYFFSRMPSSIVITTMSVNEESVIVSGITTDVESIKAFYEQLKIDKRFTEITLRNVNKTDLGYEFNLSLQTFQTL
ncbi:MAG: PilN domain-containing protein [Weeksellaceae bacterium]